LDGTGQPTLVAEVDQSKGITVETEVDVVGAGEFRYDIILFADGKWGNECIRVSLASKVSTSLHVIRHKGLSECEMLRANLKDRGTPAKPLKGTLRAAYDPEKNILAVWFNGELIGKSIMVTRPGGDGRYIMISHHQPVRTRRAWVLPKFAPVTAIAQKKPAPNAFRMLLANGDWFDPAAVTVFEGRATVMTPDGELRLPLANVVQFAFPAGSRKMTPGRDHNAIARTGRGRLKFKLTALTSEHIIGHSALLGAVKIPRKLVHSVEFLQRAAVAVPPK